MEASISGSLSAEKTVATQCYFFIHGGPGDGTNPWTFVLFAPWEEEFTVVQWDQRGAGRTLRKTGPPIAATMTLDRMAEDGIELTKYPRKHLGLNFAIPIFFLQGSEDFTSSPELARQYLGSIQAPRKEFVPINGGHFAVIMNSDQFLRELVSRVRPLAVRR